MLPTLFIMSTIMIGDIFIQTFNSQLKNETLETISGICKGIVAIYSIGFIGKLIIQVIKVF